MIDACFLIKYGPNPYDDFRFFFTVPSPQTLKTREKYEIEKLRAEIDNYGDMNEVIKLRLNSRLREGEKVSIILSIDAIDIALF